MRDEDGETRDAGTARHGDTGTRGWRVSLTDSVDTSADESRDELHHRVAASPRLPISSSPRPVSSSRRSVFFKWVVLISRFGLVALFLFTAIAKLAVIRGFVDNMGQLLSASGFNYERWSWPATITIILIEIVIAVLLIVPRTIRLGAFAAAAILIGFAGYALYYVYALNGEPLECGCFGGILASQLGVSTALRNLGLLIPAFIVWFGYRKKQTHHSSNFESGSEPAGLMSDTL